MTDSESDKSTFTAPPPPVEVTLADVSAVVSCIKQMCLGTDSALLDEAISQSASIECIQKLISDPQVGTLVLDRVITRDANPEDSADESTAVLRISNEITKRTERTISLVMLKTGTVIEADKPVEDQLYVIRIPESNPYDVLLSIFGKIGTPFFKTLVKDSGRGERDGDKLALSVEKNLSEVEVALLHMQQNIDIPEINLTIHPVIQSAIQKASEEGRKARVADLGEHVENSVFLNALQKGVSRWIKEIQKVTKLDRDAGSGTSLQEMTFWLNLERALHKITQKRESDEVTLTLEALKCGKRFHATVSFDTDTGLKQAMAMVNDYNVLMKDLPLNELMAATDMDAIGVALINIFTHMKKLRNTKYPIARALRFVEAISKDVYTQMLKVLGTRRLMNIPLCDFDVLMAQCFAVFGTWNDEYDKLSTLMRDLSKKKRDEQLKLTWRINPQHKKLEARLDQMRQFRRQHEQLRTVISRVLRPSGQAQADTNRAGEVEKSAMNGADLSAIEQVNVAYENVKEVDCLDVSNDGTAAWEAAIRRYEDQIDRVETQITARLRDQLGGAKNADEMFTIFQRFNALFVRPHIRGAIREYQTQLIQRVKEDIDQLQTRFTNFSEAANERILSTIDIPALSASIIFIRQIDRRLTQYMKRIEDVLGRGWENHVEGRQLKQEGDNFRHKLNTQHIFEEWIAKVQSRNISLTGRVFSIERRQKDGRIALKLKVNFSPDVVTLFKEVRNLKHMGFRIPLKIVNTAHQANLLYPFAISLLESIRTYDSINERIAGKEGINILIASCKRDIQNQLSEGNTLTWESYKMDPYVVKLSETISNYQEKVEELDMVLDRIEVDLAALDTCQYSSATVAALLTSIQKAVDQLSLGNYSNLHHWVENIDKRIEKKLASRVEEAIRLWTLVLTHEEMDDESEEKAVLPALQPIVLEMRVTSQVMYVSPSIEQARAHLLDQLLAWQSVVISQPRISSTRFQLALARDSTEATYRDVLARLPQGQKILEQAYTAVEKVINDVADYVGEWLRYQALWDLQPDLLYERLGSDVSKWMKTLVEIRKSRSTFDTQETRKEIFPVVVDYTKVQSKVSLKYDYWHREILQKFGTSVGQEMQTFFTEISKWRRELEEQSVDSGTTSDAIQLITYVQQLKKKTKTCQEQVEEFRAAQRLLTQQRYQFPSSWLYSENIDGEWSSLSDILERKDSAIQAQVANLQSKIKEEDEMVEKRTEDVLGEWDKSKPTKGSQKPADALAALSAFEAKLNKVREDRENMVKAKGALEMAEPIITGTHAAKLDVAVEELSDLKGVWQSLTPLYNAIEEMKEKTWLSVQPRKLRQNLDELLAQLKQLPAKYRSYESYDYAKRTMHNYSKMNMIVVELKSEALKERHWKQLMKELRVSWNLSELTLGQVWDADLLRYESAIKQVLLVAQGELALEEFLKQVREYWQSFEVDLVNYQNKTKLIRGWDELFNKLKEHMNSLTAMKLSPYYKQFEEDALAWEEKLNKISALFDVWIDVQRRWVYLEGLFSASADINTLLPVESARFASISTEFLALMKKVTAAPRILDVVNMQGAQRVLERLADMLAKIQKALGEYLERERSSFPRFYFVGDEDLLEIMGNSKDITRLQKHLKKMFAGITSIDVDEENLLVTALNSREGERVQLVKPVNIKENPRINEWLRLVETEMQSTLAHLVTEALASFSKMDISSMEPQQYMDWLDQYPAQVVDLTANIWWCGQVEKRLAEGKVVDDVASTVDATLALLADSVLREQPPIRRKKIEALITEFVHKRDICRALVASKVTTLTSFHWLRCMRFYLDTRQTDPRSCCIVKMANAQFPYGFEYLGLQEKLVQTPLTDRCYLTMTQALHSRLGGSPFGPAGTGKTESVKALGHKLGRFVLVFNCDETFDFQAMGRILVGLCQVGAWGCFDEFNRLEERMLSAVSQQIQTIQEAVRAGGDMKVDLVGKTLSVNSNMAIFITMNPGYSGRSNLPDNLKQLFRSLAMTQPDRQLIAQVMLFSQGFRTAERLANKIVPLFILCKEQLSDQCHYDFGLRALKYVLVSAGNIKRDEIQKRKESSDEGEADDISGEVSEQQILIQSVCETLVPKLISEDIALLFSLLSDVFPSVHYKPNQMAKLRAEISKVCDQLLLSQSSVPGELGSAWLEKVLQLYQITNLNHGLMLVGASGSGKTTAWKVLLRSLERLEGVEGVAHVIDAKAMSKDALYGVLDPNTREWTDGLFTHIIRKIIDNVRGETSKRQWVIFDGDVDPEWVENLNSVLDDNKLLTLPNGERLAIPPNVRIIFEVSDLKYATLATVSRCGMVWFSEEVVTCEMLFDNFLRRLKNVRLDVEQPVDLLSLNVASDDVANSSPEAERVLQLQRKCALSLTQHMSADALVPLTLNYALSELDHVMEPTQQRMLSSFFSMMNYAVRQLIAYDNSHTDFPMPDDQIDAYMSRAMLVNIVWAFSGDGKWKSRQQLSDFVRQSSTLQLPPNASLPIIDYEASLSGDWVQWVSKVPQMEVETHRVAAADLVVPTVDTVRHEMLLNTWLSEHKPLVLCGPPGSGKTMTLLSALRSLQDMDVVNVNFSSSTTPELLMRTFDHYCEYRRTPNGVVLSPVQLSRWLVIFCDEINLPAPDKYGTQRVISFLRQLVELNGFYRASDHTWVSLERIQFVGACNPPTDPGRHPLTLRFLRHVPVVYVDYPGQTSLIQIYGTFNRAMLRMAPSVRGLAEPLTSAMVDFYLQSQDRFTQDEQPHYIYSPRELTRWVRAISEAIAPLDSVSPEALVRLWAHEALRLFQDRLVKDEERQWTDELLDNVAEKYFSGSCNLKEALERPMLYSCWLTKNYLPVTKQQLKEYVAARLKGFYEEELDVQLVLFDQMLDHVLRIDRIYRQPQGHLLLIGMSGSGKTTLSRFVAWMNGLSVFQLKVHSKYTAADFDEDMRTVLRRAGCRNEKMCFIMDESNMLDTGFLERLNTLLANGEVPGLFEGDEYTSLMSQIKEGAHRQGLMLDSPDELYKWFTAQVMRNLHVVFTMNPSGEGLRERASTSPALFNRCVLNWFGDWTDSALYQVGVELTNTLDMDRSDYQAPFALPVVCDLLPHPVQYRHAVINTFVHVHNSVRKLNENEAKRGHRVMAITPRHFLDFIKHYINVFHEKRRDLEEEKLHLNIGLSKIKETEEQVLELQKSLTLKSSELEAKKSAANAKLKEMLSDQQKAEKEKIASEQLQKELAASLIEIGKKRTEVQKDLAQVEPAVEEAQQAVKGIRKTQLVEVRSMASPPHLVRLALESICLLLGENVGTDWKAIRGVMVRDDFMPRILGFDTDSITPEILKAMEKYTQNPDWDFEKVNRASSACGPMVKWVKAQLLYSDMLMKVEPLRNELKRLERDAKVKTEKGEELKKTIAQLEHSIAAYKEEYAQLIGQAETIKADLATVKEKVGRSTQLLKSLGSERDRWHGGCDGFSQQMDSLIGDALLSAAFLSYSGYYDQQLRDVLFHRWVSFVQQASIKYRSDLARVEYLSSVDERLEWNKNGLPVDELCAENAIMLHRFNRYPLIIDPSGQAMNFLLKQFKGKNITKTSFLDDSFRKNLESALRFGNALLVQDVESYDPILNPVLNREVKRTGGRILITLGDQDIDLSPSFQIFLITRDASVEFAPDVCSRVTFVNFTVTRSSLEMQCLNQALRSERPDVDEKRNDLLKLQGEFAVRLRQLEKALLAALNESKGKILDDDSVISTLEKLKTEAAEVARKAAETDKVMAEVETVSQQYLRLAQACSLIYLMMQQLNEVHFLYQYSLDFLLEMFTAVLNTPQLASISEYDKRLQIITSSLFQMVYRRVSQGMLHQDKVLLAILLMRILLKGNSQEPSHQLELDHLLGRSDVFSSQKASANSVPKLPFLDAQQSLALMQLSRLPAFSEAISKVQSIPEFPTWIAQDNAEFDVPILWNGDEKLTNIGRCMNELLVVHALRPDRLLASCHRLVASAFGVEFMQQDKIVNLREIVENEVTSNRPVLLSSAIGYDASGRVEDLAVEMGREVTSIAIGSAEGFSQADSVLNSASKSGRWILLKNVHLAPTWLTQLEKRLHALKPHPQFRLLLTAEIHPKLPASILRASRVVVFEPATGLKANLLRSLTSLAPQRMSKPPTERTRLYFLMCWLHALVQERMRYTPLGWANSYEFSDADLRVACDTLDAAVDSVAMGRSNVSPEKLPWHTLQTLLSQCIYGGKIDNHFDQKLLDCFLTKLFTPKSFDADRVLISNIDGKSTNLCIPDGHSREHLLLWVDSVHHLQLPNWLGLPNNAEKVLLTVRGEAMLANLLKVSDEELAFAGDDQKVQSPPWMSILVEQSSQWLKMLPKNIAKMRRTVDNIKDPLFRFFEREINHGILLLSDVRADLQEVHAVCRGEQKQNNHTRALTSALNKGVVPTDWLRYTVPKGITVMAWIHDFVERVNQLAKFAASKSLKKETVWLGGMFSPEAFITATRQLVAQSNQWSLEELNMRVEVGVTEDRVDSFKIQGLRLMGAECRKGNTIAVVDEVSTEMQTVALSWTREPSPSTAITLPVYLYRDRKNLLFTLDFDPGDVEKTVFYERSVAVTSNSALS
uniref:Dynein heavy chain, cytoplasmic n=6 Tax=Parascaris univalens TaxID=6257 RepID=A0A915BJF8_PARUN